MYGLTIGAGLDVALTRNIFLRAEYEYLQFQPVASTIVQINTVRAGAGIKF
jgi:opacity protein-like surface antigen